MNIERATMRIKLDEQKERAMKLRRDIDDACRNLRMGLNTALTPVEDLQVPLMAQMMDEIVLHWGALQAALSDIARLEEELN